MQPNIIPRKDWKAEKAIERRDPPIKEVTSPTHPVVAENVAAVREDAVYLTVHHSDERPKLDEDPRVRIKRLQDRVQSKKPGSYIINIEDQQKRIIGFKTIYMADIPYHYLIAPKGEILEGRELRLAARSNTKYDMPISRHITVVVEGKLTKDEPTSAQQNSLTDLLHWLAIKHKVKVNNVTHHGMVASSTCPGKHMINRMPEIRRKLHSLGVPGDPTLPCEGCKPERIAEHKRLFGAGKF